MRLLMLGVAVLGTWAILARPAGADDWGMFRGHQRLPDTETRIEFYRALGYRYADRYPSSRWRRDERPENAFRLEYPQSPRPYEEYLRAEPWTRPLSFGNTPYYGYSPSYRPLDFRPNTSSGIDRGPSVRGR